HRFAHGKDVGSLPLERLADVPGVLVDATGRGRALDEGLFLGKDLAGKAVLVRTGWDAHWRTPRYGEGHPYLTRGAAEHLAGAGRGFFGFAPLNATDLPGGVLPAPPRLLGGGIPMVDHLPNRGALPESGSPVHCVRPPFRGRGSFPGRAYAVVPYRKPDPP